MRSSSHFKLLFVCLFLCILHPAFTLGVEPLEPPATPTSSSPDPLPAWDPHPASAPAEVPSTAIAPAASLIVFQPAPDFVPKREHFHWGAALWQTFEFDTVMHLERLTNVDTIPDSGHGNVFADYIRSVGNLHGWDDHDRFMVQYIQHSFQGAADARIELQNNPNGRMIEWGERGYWRSRLIAMAWAGLWGAQFKIGPYSEAMIGNVGLPDQYRKHPLPPDADYGKMAWSEFVVNPAFGTVWVITEDLLDHYVVRRVENTGNDYATFVVRSFLTPSRGWANILRFRPPWYRDGRNLGSIPR